MSSASDTRSSSLDIINAVLQKMGETEVLSLSDTRYSKMLLQILNEVLSFLDDFGDWEEAYETLEVTPVINQSVYELVTDYPIKRIDQVFWRQNRGSLKKITKREMNHLTMHDAEGVPNFWTIFNVDAVFNPKLKVYPTPNYIHPTDKITVFYYKKTPLLTTDDNSYIPLYPVNVIIKGVYAWALLEQNDGEATAPIQAARLDFENSAQEALNRFTNDTGTSLRFVPSSWYGRC